MNPSVGTNSSQCTGYSDYTVGNSNSGDGNTTGLEYSTNVTLNETYSLEVEGGFCGIIPSQYLLLLIVHLKFISTTIQMIHLKMMN